MGRQVVWPVEDLAALVGDARMVLLGEATHGTHEFYLLRAELTRRLIAEHGFRAVAVEADWPAAARVDRYVRGAGQDRCAEQALGGFVRFPRWTWRNQVIVDLVDWLRQHGRGAGFHGLDLHSLRESTGSRIDAWNLRDTHMADTLDALHAHLGGAPIVVWAHNSHVGDARATEMGPGQGELSLGQLARQRHGRAACLVGFTTHAGTLTAADDWGGPAEHRVLRPSLDGSIERLLHDCGIGCGVVDLRDLALGDEELLGRMVGVVYQPALELWNHYMKVRPADQFDLLVHVDQTTALEPLDRWPALADPAETLPAGP